MATFTSIAEALCIQRHSTTVQQLVLNFYKGTHAKGVLHGFLDLDSTIHKLAHLHICVNACMNAYMLRASSRS